MNGKGINHKADEYIAFFRRRLTQLRENKGVSEYKMSRDLGHSTSYINGLSVGNTLPSFSEFFYICDYLNVTPQDFFNVERKAPQLINILCDEMLDLSDDDINMLILIAKHMGKNKNK